MDSKKLQHFKNRLLEERKETQELLDKKEESEKETIKAEDRELSSYENHPADTGTDLYMREQDLGFQERYKEKIKEIDQSLADIENGNYGYCSNCDQMISEERLELIPYAKTCIKCLDQREDKGDID